MDCSEYTVRKYLNDGKTHVAIDIKLLKKLDNLNNSLYEIQLTKAHSLYLVLAEKELRDCVPAEMKAECEQLLSKDCNYIFTADPVRNFSPDRAVSNTKKTWQAKGWAFQRKVQM